MRSSSWSRARAGAIAALAALALASPAPAQNAADPKVWGDSVMAALQSRGVEGFLDIIEKDTYLGQTSAQQLRDLRPRAVREARETGAVVAWEHVGDVSLGSPLKTICYVAKGERMPTLVAFRMYRVDQSWNLINFVFYGPDRIGDNECRSLWK